ncbi:Protein of unknown function [Pyronema omphalodes CBS 100304]|uniref:Uncharacterized protein n=1 Tax=Pyronema omphalodes (strain CBS 100304) TaxID=1076935 RepID=U4KWD7_PYROM|nr:Protein of unknown function [Pyronema omphalodes CBS 100304]
MTKMIRNRHPEVVNPANAIHDSAAQNQSRLLCSIIIRFRRPSSTSCTTYHTCHYPKVFYKVGQEKNCTKAELCKLIIQYEI